MWYNYARFENPFEFGQFYQLTLNDPSQQPVELGMSIEGIMAYLFNPPKFNREFPFVEFTKSDVRNGNVIYSGLIYQHSQNSSPSSQTTALHWSFLLAWGD